MSLLYQKATQNDTQAIAHLHALSWQLNYRGAVTDAYLDHQVFPERLVLWTKRLQDPTSNQYTLMAKEGPQLAGFACVFAEADPQWGALLDNIHVRPEFKGQAIGKSLMQRCAQWVYERIPASKMYLWVLEKNTAAIGFYEHIGGYKAESDTYQMPDDSLVKVLRIAWDEVSTLASLRV